MLIAPFSLGERWNSKEYVVAMEAILKRMISTHGTRELKLRDFVASLDMVFLNGKANWTKICQVRSRLTATIKILATQMKSY